MEQPSIKQQAKQLKQLEQVKQHCMPMEHYKVDIRLGLLSVKGSMVEAIQRGLVIIMQMEWFKALYFRELEEVTFKCLSFLN